MKLSGLRCAVLLLAGCSLCAARAVCQMPASVPGGAAKHDDAVKMKCDKRSGTCVLRWKDGTTLGPIAAAVELVDGTRWATTDLPRHEMKTEQGSPKGLVTAGMREVVIRHYGKQGAPELRQHIYLAPGQPYALMDLEVVGTGPLSSRHISPVVLAAGGSARLAVKSRPTCLVPAFDGAYFSEAWKEALWGRHYTGAPQRQRRSVERYSIVKRA